MLISKPIERESRENPVLYASWTFIAAMNPTQHEKEPPNPRPPPRSSLIAEIFLSYLTKCLSNMHFQSQPVHFPYVGHPLATFSRWLLWIFDLVQWKIWIVAFEILWFLFLWYPLLSEICRSAAQTVYVWHCVVPSLSCPLSAVCYSSPH